LQGVAGNDEFKSKIVIKSVKIQIEGKYGQTID